MPTDYTEHVALARFFYPGVMPTPVYCPLDELFFYAGGVILSTAHGCHLAGDGESVDALVDALSAMNSYDPHDTDAIMADMVAAGFQVAAPITGTFYPEVTHTHDAPEGGTQ